MSLSYSMGDAYEIFPFVQMIESGLQIRSNRLLEMFMHLLQLNVQRGM